AVEDFFYRTITVERPLRLNYAFAPERVERALVIKPVSRLPEHEQTSLREALERAAAEFARPEAEGGAGGVVSTNRVEFNKRLHTVVRNADVVLKPAVLRAVLAELSEPDPD